MLSKRGVQQRSGKGYHCGLEKDRGKEQRSEYDDGGRAMNSPLNSLLQFNRRGRQPSTTYLLLIGEMTSEVIRC